MKLLLLSTLALGLAKVWAQSDECVAEFAKYSECISGLTTDNLDNMESLNLFCQTFDDEKCQEFVAESHNTSIACDAEQDETNRELSVLIYTMKISYLTYCIKDDNGNVCPLTKLIMDRAAQGITTSSQELSDEEKAIYTEDCKIDQCNSRLISVVDVTQKLSTAVGSLNTSESEFKAYADKYQSKQCDSLFTNDAAPTTDDNANGNGDGTAATDSNSGSIESVKKFTFTFAAIIVLLVIFSI